MGVSPLGEFVGPPAAPAKKPPIRPVGFTSLKPSAGVAWTATTILLLVCTGCVWYFNQLRRHDWLSRVSRYDQALFDFGESVIAGQVPDSTWVGATQGAPRSAPSRTQVDYEYLNRLLSWFPTMLWTVTAAALFDLGAFLVWQCKAHRNLSALGSEGLRFGSATALVWWFVPVAVLWLPHSVVQEIWRGSDPTVPVGDSRAWRLRHASMLVHGWWAAAVLSKALYWCGGLMLVLSLISLLSPIALLATAFVFTVLSCGLQIELIRRVTQRQAKLYERRTLAAEKALTAGLPIVDAQPLHLVADAAPATS